MASGRVPAPRYRVVDPVRDVSGHHPHDAAFLARRAPLPDPSPQDMQKQQALRGAATPMPRQPSEKVNPGLLPRRINPAPLPPRPKLRRIAPVTPAAAGAATQAHLGEAAAAGAPGPSILTPEQKVLVEELRARVADALRDDPGAARLGDESALHRFICARQGSVADAEAMFRGRLEWHREVIAAACRLLFSTSYATC